MTLQQTPDQDYSYHCAIAALKQDQGLVLWRIYPHSIKRPEIKLFLRDLLLMDRTKNTAVFWDNLKVHHNPQIRAQLRRKQVQVLYNVPYQPSLNPIEYAFKIVKDIFRRELVIMEVKKAEIDMY